MKLHPPGPSRSPSLFHSNRSRMRWLELLIAVLFIVSLLIGSGIFVKASNAASAKTQAHKGLTFSEIQTIPGAMRFIDRTETSQGEQSSSVIYTESEDSCELKIKS